MYAALTRGRLSRRKTEEEDAERSNTPVPKSNAAETGENGEDGVAATAAELEARRHEEAIRQLDVFCDRAVK